MNLEKKIKNLPEPIKSKLYDTKSEVDRIINEADAVQKTKFTGKISFSYEQSAPMDILTPFERAQSVCFISRYEHLPVLGGLEIFEHDSKFFLKNISFIRHILNEYRSIIFNQKDSVYFGKIHKFCHEKLMNRNPSEGLSITVIHKKDGDITRFFVKFLGEKNKSIKIILQKSEFGYIYNGILQHSDHIYTERFWNEYNTGKLNYVFVKHAALLGYIKSYLYWHYTILNQLAFARLGPLYA